MILGDLIKDLGCNYEIAISGLIAQDLLEIAISGLIARDCNGKSKIHRWILGFNWTKNELIKNNWIQIKLIWN